MIEICKFTALVVSKRSICGSIAEWQVMVAYWVKTIRHFELLKIDIMSIEQCVQQFAQ